MEKKTVIKLNESQFIEIVNKTAKKMVDKYIANNNIKLLENRLAKRLNLKEDISVNKNEKIRYEFNKNFLEGIVNWSSIDLGAEIFVTNTNIPEVKQNDMILIKGLGVNIENKKISLSNHKISLSPFYQDITTKIVKLS